MNEKYFEFIAAIETSDHMIVNEFLAQGINLLLVSRHTLIFPLHHAVSVGDVEIVKAILSARNTSDLVREFDDISHTPLMVAVANANVALVRFLLDAGSDVNQHDEMKAGDTAIKIAVKQGNLEMTKLLLDRGADPSIRGWMQLSAIDVAKQQVELTDTKNCREILALFQKTLR